MRTHLKSFVLILAILLVLAVPVNTTVFAAEEASIQEMVSGEEDPGGGIGIDSIYYEDYDTYLSIDAYGFTTVQGYLEGVRGQTTRVTIYLYLQKYIGGTWTNIASWNQTFYDDSGSMTENSLVSSGYYYRVKGSYYAYIGTSYDHVYDYSSVIYH